jgi:hypothetical protein
MKNKMFAGMFMLILGAFAQADSLEEIRRDLERVKTEIADLKAENAALKEQLARGSAAGPAAATSNPSAKPELAQRVETLEKSGSRVSWRGDFRFRHEIIDPEEAIDEQTRQRIRARFGASLKVNDSITGVVQLATNGGTGDPRSTNQTLTNAFDRKGVGIDLAYVDWKINDTLNLQLGKMPIPWHRVNSFMWDGNLTPEGGAIKFASGKFFASAFGYWLSERATAADATLSGAQVGIKTNAGPVKLTSALGYFDVGAVQGEVTAVPAGCLSAVNTAFFNGSQGNTTLLINGCPRLANDFDMLQFLTAAEFKIGGSTLGLFADVTQNQEAEDLDLGYSFGVNLGRPAWGDYSWDIGYVYRLMEKDAAFGQFIDIDFGGGITDHKGHALRASLTSRRNWALNATYFSNDRFVDVGIPRDYERLQLDVNYRY